MLKVSADTTSSCRRWRLPDRQTTDKGVFESPAVRLFVERAQAAGQDVGAAEPEWLLRPRSAAGWMVCLSRFSFAAARLRVLTPQALLPRLDRRLQLLKSGPGNLPERQKTLRNAIAWSHDLLDAGEQALFRRLSVFARRLETRRGRGGCGRPIYQTPSSTFCRRSWITASCSESKT